MAYLTIARVSGEPSLLVDAYHQTADQMTEVGRDHGLIAHAAGPADDGLVIVNLWPSRDHSEAAAGDSRRRQVVPDHGLGPERFSREHLEIANYVLLDR
jgi:hypothetical protein